MWRARGCWGKVESLEKESEVKSWRHDLLAEGPVMMLQSWNIESTGCPAIRFTGDICSDSFSLLRSKY